MLINSAENFYVGYQYGLAINKVGTFKFIYENLLFFSNKLMIYRCNPMFSVNYVKGISTGKEVVERFEEYYYSKK
jgi:hypothetical protein